MAEAVVSYQLSVISFQFSVISFQSSIARRCLATFQPIVRLLAASILATVFHKP